MIFGWCYKGPIRQTISVETPTVSKFTHSVSCSFSHFEFLRQEISAAQGMGITFWNRQEEFLT